VGGKMEGEEAGREVGGGGGCGGLILLCIQQLYFVSMGMEGSLPCRIELRFWCWSQEPGSWNL
jgi:hypothetical protein